MEMSCCGHRENHLIKNGLHECQVCKRTYAFIIFGRNSGKMDLLKRSGLLKDEDKL